MIHVNGRLMVDAVSQNSPMSDHNDPLKVRKTALDILNRVDQGNRTLDNILEEILETEPFPAKRDRSLLQALVFGVLRWRGRLDYVISSFSRTPFSRIDPPIRNVLRLGLFQILYLSRIPPSAAVNTAVELAKASSPPWVARFVNGVLRNAARDHAKVNFPDIEREPVSAISACKSFPNWLIRRWVKAVGLDETLARCNAINRIPALTLRTNTLKTDRGHLLQTLAGEAATARPCDIAPDGIALSNLRKRIPEIDAFNAGWFQVQDEAAQLVSLLTGPRSGEKVLDACAGLGGKTGHMAQLMENIGPITALDINPAKLKRLERQMHRLGVSCVHTRTHDLNRPPGKNKFGHFDRVLLDAPCTGLGVLRRNPDAKWKTRESMIYSASEKQVRLLCNLAHLVKPGGHLVYAVCSTEPEENETVVDRFLQTHSEFIKANPSERLPQAVASLLGPDGSLKTSPDKHNMDGFYCVGLKRIQ